MRWIGVPIALLGVGLLVVILFALNIVLGVLALLIAAPFAEALVTRVYSKQPADRNPVEFP